MQEFRDFHPFEVEGTTNFSSFWSNKPKMLLETESQTA